VRVEETGDTDLLMGTLIDSFEFEQINEEIERRNQNGEELHPATASPVLMGITKASLATDSFLSAPPSRRRRGF
jgi:DNA-directed RNA polymerase subunit beta'